ncbi:MAG: helix-turn-helix domain-containing protein [Sedimenticola sp.]
MFQETELNLKKLGDFLRLARRRRGWRQEDAAERLSVGIDTVKRAEKGQKGVSIGCILNMLSLYQRMTAFQDVIDPSKDEVGISQQAERLPARETGRRYDTDF